MFKLIKRQPRTMVGVDISTSAVKVLELGQYHSGYSIESYGVAALPKDAVIENDIKDITAVSEALKIACERANLHASQAVVAIPDSSVIRKTVKMDSSLSEDDLEHLVMIEAEKFVPYPLDEVSLDFIVAKKNDSSRDLDDVLVVAARTEIVNNRASVVNLAGLSAKIIETESFALQRVCRFIHNQLHGDANKQVVAVVDVGSIVTTLTVLKNLEVTFSREEIFGGAQLTHDIMKQYGMSYSEAGLAKKRGDLPDDYESEVLAPFRELAVMQIRRALQFYFSLDQSSKIDNLLLVGGTACIPGLVDELGEQLGIPTMLANPFSNMALGKHVNVEKVTKDASSMTTCCGLALRSFGL